jgi:YD repeat-containing protein
VRGTVLNLESDGHTFTATASGAYLWAGNFTVAAGDTLTWEITVRGAGSTLTDALGFNAGSQGWGDSTTVTATILSGPGTISVPNGNPLTLSGLQTNADTRIRITRTFAAAGTAAAFFYLKGGGTAAVGDAVTLSAPNIVKATPNPQAVAATTSYDYDQLGLVRVVTDATNNKSYIEYDAVGRKIADIDQAGNVVEYKYDADNRVIATVRYATALSSAALTSLQSAPTAFDFASNRPADTADSLWTFNVYDNDGRTI